MTERGLPIVESAAACPFVALDDARDDRADRADPRHRCYAESPPTPRARAHQEAYCLSAQFPVCPTFQDWARREAARVAPAAAAGSPAERLRDVPAQREAGARPPAFTSESGDWSGSAGASGPREEDAPSAGDGGILDPERAPDPWDLPPRRPAQQDWSAPPPWAKVVTPAAESDTPAFLHPGTPARPGTGSTTSGSPTPPKAAAGAMAGLDALDDAVIRDESRPWTLVPDDSDQDDGRPAGLPAGWGASAAQRPSGMSRSVDPSAGLASGRGLADVPDMPRVARRAAATGGEPGEPVEPRGRPSGGIGQLLGIDRRPRVGSSRSAKRAEREPAWERPRRYEAYPTLKTRVGLPMPSRLMLAVVALAVAAGVLFFVPPLFLGGGAGGPGATPTPVPSESDGEASPSVKATPTPRPTKALRTYTVRAGDTLSRIATTFGVTVEAIIAANKDLANPDKIAIGDVIVIPSAAPQVVVDGGASASP